MHLQRFAFLFLRAEIGRHYRYIGYNLDTKYVNNYKDILQDDFLYSYKLEQVA